MQPPDSQVWLESLAAAGRPESELVDDPEVWRAEAAVEAAAAIRACLLRSAAGVEPEAAPSAAAAAAYAAAVAAAAGAPYAPPVRGYFSSAGFAMDRDAVVTPAAATAAAAEDGGSSSSSRARELPPGVAFVEVVAARVMSQPEWGFSRGLLLQLGVCQMRRMMRQLHGEDDVDGVRGMLGQIQVGGGGGRGVRTVCVGAARRPPADSCFYLFTPGILPLLFLATPSFLK